jgi:hypothetical protein
MLPTVALAKTRTTSRVLGSDSRHPLLELDRLAREIEDELLAFASAGAREEWTRFKEACSTAAGAAPRRVVAPEDELAFLVDKARRFRAVLLRSA